MPTSPIVLFVYNRPWHTRQTLEALCGNALASDSDLYIYSDAAKGPDQADKVAETREYIRTVQGFRTVTVIERDRNHGLADNIISGVTEVIKAHGKVIVLEDDIVTSAGFLTFMNGALNHYRDTENVWHISGWNYPIDPEGLDDTFFYRAMNCWGWATWDDRWRHFEKNPGKLIRDFTRDDISRFDLDDSGAFWKQVIANAKGKADTWAIFWYATLFTHNALCLNPTVSYVDNIGQDGSGENCSRTPNETTSVLNSDILVYSDDVHESEIAVSKIRDYYRLTRGNPYSGIFRFAQRYANKLIR